MIPAEPRARVAGITYSLACVKCEAGWTSSDKSDPCQWCGGEPEVRDRILVVELVPA